MDEHLGQRAPDAPAVELIVVRADNPGPMTLTGTNSHVLRDEGQVWVVDPGPKNPEHLAELLLTCGDDVRPEGVLVTHRHADHAAGAPGGTEAPVIEYGYLLDEDPTLRPDPRSRRQPYGPHGPSATVPVLGQPGSASAAGSSPNGGWADRADGEPAPTSASDDPAANRASDGGWAGRAWDSAGSSCSRSTPSPASTTGGTTGWAGSRCRRAAAGRRGIGASSRPPTPAGSA